MRVPNSQGFSGDGKTAFVIIAEIDDAIDIDALMREADPVPQSALRNKLFSGKDREWILMAGGHHDDAYDKARKLRLQAVDGERLPKVVVEEIRRVVVKPVIESVNSREAPSGFIGLSEKDMAAVGVPSEAQAPLLKITTEEGLLSFLEKRVKWSARLKDVLMDLFTDPARLSEFAKEWDEQKNHPPIRSALKDSPTAAEQFVILDDEMRRKFYNGKLEKWQVFLHPSQRRAVEMKETNGPAMVTGAAGTGKTVVAVHRAKWLLENRFRNGGTQHRQRAPPSYMRYKTTASTDYGHLLIIAKNAVKFHLASEMKESPAAS